MLVHLLHNCKYSPQEQERLT